VIAALVRLAGFRARRVTASMAVIVVLAAGVGCAAPMTADSPAVDWPPREGEPSRIVWVVRHGFHTRLAVRRSDVDPRLWPESGELGAVEYLEVGWGDRDFYPTPEPSIRDAVSAVVRATNAALHVGGFEPSPPEFLPGQPIVRIAVTPRGFDHLTRFFHEHYARDAAGEPVRIRPGYYDRSWFYEAAGRYNALVSNSNDWIAAALRVAGVPTGPDAVLTAGGVIAEARRFGTLVGGAQRRRADR
jgi:uncharacterized protein (TIGR02117 family)